jgi:hypothetical protein
LSGKALGVADFDPFAAIEGCRWSCVPVLLVNLASFDPE